MTENTTLKPARGQLTEAVRRNDARAVEDFLERGADVEDVGEHGDTALMLAVDKDPEIVRLLVDWGADPKKRNNFGESNSLFFILTADLGLIIASAQAVRESASKLSSALQEHSLISVSCVKGKNGWKITNAIPKENFFFDQSLAVQKLVSQISAILVRMMPGEEKHREVFFVVLGGFLHLKNVSEKNISNFECLMMLRILYHLGYIDKNSQTENFLQDDNDWHEKILQEVASTKSTLVWLINKGLEESQL